jgi:hypothetical protein
MSAVVNGAAVRLRPLGEEPLAVPLVPSLVRVPGRQLASRPWGRGPQGLEGFSQ